MRNFHWNGVAQGWENFQQEEASCRASFWPVLGGLLAVPFTGGSVIFAKGKFGSKPTLVDGIPDVVAGDTAGIYSSTPNSPALLSGIFQSGNRHDDNNDDDDDEDEDEDDDD
jgi:hypothetical protein